MNPYIKTFYLEQQTPIIHFQHYQDGATLRATEVKPKLDRFIIKKAKKPIDKKWFVGSTEALNYKMQFVSQGSHTVDLGYRTDYDIYYGNMGEHSDNVKGVMATAPVKMIIKCLYPELMQVIKDSLCDFFIVTNFGRMQNKGFGSFVLDKDESGREITYTDKKIKNALCSYYGAKTCYAFPGGKVPFGRIKTVYSLMKSGINIGNNYRRSLLFNYMHSVMGLGNEKAYLKKNGYAPAIGKAPLFIDPAYDNQPSKYVRALLGTGDHLDFMLQPGNPRNKKSIKIDGGKIERFASTVFFKVLGNTVFFVGKRIPDIILDKEFSFISEYSKSTAKIRTPGPNKISKNFMDGFLDYCCRELNKTKLPDGDTPMKDYRNMQNVTIREVN